MTEGSVQPDLRVLMLTRYGRTGSSSRLRSLQYIPVLEAHGIRATALPLFVDAQLAHRFSTGRRKWLSVPSQYWARARQLRSVDAFDLVWVEKELFPFLPEIAERLAIAGRLPVILDYDDATFHRYQSHPNRGIRWLLGPKISKLVRRADAVVAGSPYLAGWMADHGGRIVEMVPTSVDLSRYVPGGADVRPDRPLTVGWIGTPRTSKYLEIIAEPLQQVAQQMPVRLLTIGAETASIPGVTVESRPWSEATEVADLHDVDVGVMPLTNEPFERGKCGYKLIQYMALGIPAVASPVGANTSIISNGINGYLASRPEDWATHILALGTDRELATGLGRAGRATVEERYSVGENAPRLAALMRRVAGAA